jgi:hypothetical protein
MLEFVFEKAKTIKKKTLALFELAVHDPMVLTWPQPS